MFTDRYSGTYLFYFFYSNDGYEDAAQVTYSHISLTVAVWQVIFLWHRCAAKSTTALTLGCQVIPLIHLFTWESRTCLSLFAFFHASLSLRKHTQPVRTRTGTRPCQMVLSPDLKFQCFICVNSGRKSATCHTYTARTHKLYTERHQSPSCCETMVLTITPPYSPQMAIGLHQNWLRPIVVYGCFFHLMLPTTVKHPWCKRPYKAVLGF